jgi:Cu(I)/Ag(I) efflux system membrane fusion protein
MKKYRFILLVIFLLALSFLAGYWVNYKSAEKKGGSANRKILYYIDPMHPAYKSDKPGIAPDCGMKLEPVYEDGSAGNRGEGDSSLPPGTVNISPRKQQLIGVRVAIVEKAPQSHNLRTVGRITPDEKCVYRLVAGIDGWIRETYNNDTGTLVKKDERLASFYSPQFRAAQLAYLSILGSGDDRFQAGGRQALAPSQQASISLQTYIDALESLGMSEQQMKELASTRQITDRVFIMAPVTGFIIARNVSPGQRFDKGTEWYRIADLSRVWVLADLFRNEAEYVRPGMKVRVTLPHQKKEYHAMVSTVLPQFDPNSRTLNVRLELDNPGYTLRPDMFVDVEFPITLPAALTVPADAVLDSGIRKTVFVDKSNGYFEPRKVETGWRFGDRIEITKGLMPGERIVVSGTFLIDSESRMKAAAAGIYGESSKDPVCGMYVDEGKAKASGKTSEYHGKTYYFCSDGCKQQFDKDPGRYIGKSDGKNGLHRKPGSENMQALSAARVHKDPICGMDVDEKSARAAGRTSEYQGKTYYFCSDGCKQQFDKEPERYIEKKAGKAQNAEHPTTSAPIHN